MSSWGHVSAFNPFSVGYSLIAHPKDDDDAVEESDEMLWGTSFVRRARIFERGACEPSAASERVALNASSCFSLNPILDVFRRLLRKTARHKPSSTRKAAPPRAPPAITPVGTSASIWRLIVGSFPS